MENYISFGVFRGFTSGDMRAWLAVHTDMQALADAYAAADTHLTKIIYETDAIPPGSKEEAWAMWAVDEWHSLETELRTHIAEFLRQSGTILPTIGYHKVLADFMAEYGYCDANGWWLRDAVVQ